jgi:hypothetical protein
MSNVNYSNDQPVDALAPPEYPREEVVLYEASPRAAETNLFIKLLQLDPSETLFRHHFKTARYVLAELGACASDLVWRRALMQIEASASPLQGDDRSSNQMSAVVADDVKLTVRDIVKNWVFSMPNLDPTSRGCNVTPKFVKLVEVLKACEPFGESFRGIVFGESISEARIDDANHPRQCKEGRWLWPSEISFVCLQIALAFFGLVSSSATARSQTFSFRLELSIRRIYR